MGSRIAGQECKGPANVASLLATVPEKQGPKGMQGCPRVPQSTPGAAGRGQEPLRDLPSSSLT